MQDVDTVSIVLVDDDPIFVGMAEDMLTNADPYMDVETFTDPDEALDQIIENRDQYDCVICDYKMPSMDGLEFYQNLLEKDYEKPFYILTNKGDEEVANVALELGVTDYVTKQNSPEKYAALAHRIRNSVKYHRKLSQSSDYDTVSTHIIEESPDCVLIHNGKEIVYVNDNFANYANANRRQQIIGREPSNVIDTNDYPLEWPENEAPEYAWHDGVLYTVDGEEKEMKLTATAIPYREEGRVYRFLLRP